MCFQTKGGRGAYRGDFSRCVDRELGESSLDGEGGKESDGNESGVHRGFDVQGVEQGAQAGLKGRGESRGNEVSARMEERDKMRKKSENGLRPRVRLVTRQQRDRPNTHKHNTPAHAIA